MTYLALALYVLGALMHYRLGKVIIFYESSIHQSSGIQKITAMVWPICCIYYSVCAIREKI